MHRILKQPMPGLTIAPQIQRFLYLSLAFLVFLTGCSGGEKTQDLILEKTIPPAPVVTVRTPEPTHEPTRERTLTATATLEPTPLPIRTATQTPTFAPVPTLPAETLRKNVIELLTTNGDCEFPCWWGIDQGDPVEKVLALSERLGETPSVGWDGYGYWVSLNEFKFAEIRVDIIMDDNQLVQRIQVELNEPVRLQEYHAVLEDRLSLQNVLVRYGKPSEVLFASPPLIEPSPQRTFILFVIYDEQDFGIVYNGVTGLRDPMRLCQIKTMDREGLMLYAHNPHKDIPKMNDSQFMELQPLEEVTNMTLDDFYQAFSSPNNSKCIESSLEIWQ